MLAALIAVVDLGLASKYPGDRPLGYIVSALAALMCVERVLRIKSGTARPTQVERKIDST